ncbi:MAG: hypothetical protein EPO09_21085 [Aquabacterium sp.]|uniref:hypothetical protein n=1 Tax=Aquabacterium sp. TaxID=1872578 RepID=UPI00121D4F8D|nr:hypothetical protein [Aquabacterium sp.]TAK84230.1 MAG: hypothetical protein EPO09_21085 [Aquabacterium sp.]
MSKQAIPLRPTILLLTLLISPCFAKSAPLNLGNTAVQIIERDGSQSDKLVIKAKDRSYALDLNRSAGVRGVASLTADGVLIAGPYVLDTRQGKLVRRSQEGYFAASPQLDAQIRGQQIALRAGARHWHCPLPFPPIEPRGIAARANVRTGLDVLVFGAHKDSESGITVVHPMMLNLLSCHVQQPTKPLDFDHSMIVPQANKGGWWAYSVSEPKLALSSDGINWRYPSLPAHVRSLLSAFVDEQGATWIATSVVGHDDDLHLYRQAMGSEEWLAVQTDERSVPPDWLEGRLLLISDPRP